MKLIALCCLLLYSFDSLSCSCAGLGKITNEEITSVDQVFIGTIKSITEDETNFNVVATFEITTELKGEPHLSEITIATSNSGASCGLNFKKGQKWYIFAYSHENQLYAGLCGRSVQLSKLNGKLKRRVVGRGNYRRDRKRARQDIREIRAYFDEK